MNNHQKLRELLCLKLKLMRLRRKRLLLSASQKPRRIHQRNILQKRPAVGEFSTLVSDLKSEPKDFFEYFWMQRAALTRFWTLLRKRYGIHLKRISELRGTRKRNTAKTGASKQSMYRDPLEKILYAKRNLYAFRVKSRNFLH